MAVSVRNDTRFSGGDWMEVRWGPSIRVHTWGSLPMSLPAAALRLLPLLRTGHTAVCRHHVASRSGAAHVAACLLGSQPSPNIRSLPPVVGPGASQNVASRQTAGRRHPVQSDPISQAHLKGRLHISQQALPYKRTSQADGLHRHVFASQKSPSEADPTDAVNPEPVQ